MSRVMADDDEQFTKVAEKLGFPVLITTILCNWWTRDGNHSIRKGTGSLFAKW